jgi:hypothetical protein
VRATWLAHLILFDLSILIIVGEELWNSSLCSFLASCHFIRFRSKYSPHHTVLKHLSLCFSLNVRDQISHPYKTTGKIIVFNLHSHISFHGIVFN